MDIRLIRLLVAVLMLALTGCVSGTSENSFGDKLPIPDSTTSITSGDLRIGPMDSIQISVFGVEDLDGEYQVDFEGLLKLPLIGNIDAVGLTASELSNVLETAYGETYLRDPSVRVTISESVGRRITVDGSVRSPGLYDITGDLTLLQAVALAGGPAEGANPKKVVVFREISGERKAAAFDLLAIRKGESDDPQIFGNDIVIMDGSEARAIYGELLDSVRLIALFLAF